MANGEDKVVEAIKGGDAQKIAKAHAEYTRSMERSGQKPKSLDYFRARAR